MDQAHKDRLAELEAVQNRDENQEKELADIRELARQDEVAQTATQEQADREEKKAAGVASVDEATGESVG